MSSRLKKIGLSIIIFLLIVLAFGQVRAQEYSQKISSGEKYYVSLQGNKSSLYPFVIKAGNQLMFCNQHGAALRNGTYYLNWYHGWLSYQDALAYVFSNYGEKWLATDGTQVNLGTPSGTRVSGETNYTAEYRMLQRIVWNIDTINREIAKENDFSGQNRYWQSTVYTLNNAGLDTSATNLIAEAGEFINLKDKVIENNNQYPCTLEQVTTDSVSINTDENTYIVGKFKVNYLKSVVNNKTLANITAIDVVSVGTNEKIQNVKFQKADDGSLYQDGQLPNSGEEFNVIIPYNANQEVKKIKLVVHYKYLAYCEAYFSQYRLASDTDSYAWQNQLTYDGGYQQWIEGTKELQTQISPWTFELQKVGKESGRPLSNVKFEIGFYDVNGSTKKADNIYTTNSRGIIQIPGLDFYGDLKIKIREVSTNNGYTLDSTEKWISVHKDSGPTSKFTNIQYEEDEIAEVDGNDGLKLTALIENAQEGFNLDIIKVDSSTENELSGATFTVRLEKIGVNKTQTVYYKTGLKSPVVSITDQDIKNYIGEHQIDHNYDIEGRYVAYIKETKVPNYYRTNLLNKEITVEFTVSNKFFSSMYEIDISNITMNNTTVSEDLVKAEDNSTNESASLSIYIKNQRRSSGGPGGGPSSKYYSLNLEKFGVRSEDIADESKYYSLNDIPFTIKFYQIQNGEVSKTPLRSNTYTTSSGKITLSSLTYTGDILVQIEEQSSNGNSIVGNVTKYIRYKATRSGIYYYITDYYYADANGNKLKENSDLKLSTDGIRLNTSGTSYIPVLNVGILNAKDPDIDLTMDIKGTVFLDAATGKAGQVDGLYDGADDPIKGIEVTLCDTEGNKITKDNLTNPVRTDDNGQYAFTDLNPMKKYIVKFTYNGQDYQATDVLSDSDYTSAKENGYDSVELWEQYSKAQEDLLHGKEGDITRETLNNRFATISAAPDSYTRADGSTNKAYSDEVMAEVYNDILEAIDQGKNTSEEISDYLEEQNKIEELTGMLNFAKDCEIVAYTKEYPAMNKFNLSDTDKTLYTVDWDTQTILRPAENYPALYEGQNQINFGLKERPNVDLMLSEDVFETKVTVNGQTTTYSYNRKLANGEDSEVVLYDQDIRSFDIERNQTSSTDGKAYYDTPSDLRVEVFYKVRLYNDSETKAEVTQIVDYYDSEFYAFEAAYLGDENGYDEDTVAYLGDNNEDKSITFGDAKKVKDQNGNDTKYTAQAINIKSQDENIMTPSGSRYVYIKLKTNDEPTSLAKLVDEIFPEEGETEKVETRNYVEISQYKTYYGTTVNSGSPGLVDKDSIAGNFDLERYDAEDREDDENKAPELFYKLPSNNSRSLSGNVFEDLRSNLSTGDVVKDSMTDGDNIKGIEGIKVELVELVKEEQPTEVTIEKEQTRATILTDANGNYKFTNFIPGKYFVRFTYGDKVYTVGGTNKTLSSQDYQSTYANPYTNKNDLGKDVTYWYAETNDNGDVILNNEQVGYNNSIRYSDAYDKVQDRENSITYSETMTNANVVALKKYSVASNNSELDVIKSKMTMQAYTSTLDLEVEFATKNTWGNQSKSYAIENIDFGLIKRAESNLELEKRVSHIKITQADNTVLLDADVEMRNNALVLLYNGEQIQNDKVHFQYISTPNAYGTGAVRLEIDDEILHGNNIEITYTLTVRNTTPKATTLTWFKEGDNRAVGYYEENKEDLVYYENGAIKYHAGGTVESYTNISINAPETVKTKANQIVDYVSNNMQFDDTQNFGYWELAEKTNVNSYLANDDVKSEAEQYNNILLVTADNPLTKDWLEPGEYREAELVLSTTNTQDVDLEYTNITEILSLSNQAGRVDAVSTPGNLKPVSAKVVNFERENKITENNVIYGAITYYDNNTSVINRTQVELARNPYTSGDNPYIEEGANRIDDVIKTTTTEREIYEPDSAKAETITITAPTGDTHYYYVLIGSMLVIFALGIIGIKKFVLNKK